MLPVVESKGAFYIGVSLKLRPWVSMLTCVVSGLLLTIVLLLFYDTLINILINTKCFKKIALKLKSRQTKKAQTFLNKNKNKSKLGLVFAVFLFVAVPLPLTGVYTGSLLASSLKLNKPLSILAITLGNFVAILILNIPLLFV